MAKTNFGKLNAQIQQDIEKRKGGSSNKKFEKVEWAKIPYGDSIFMILPPKDEDGDFFHEVHVHHNFQDKNGKQRSYQCSKKKHGSCPICERVDKLTKEGLVKEAGQMKAAKTFLYNVLDYSLNMKVAPLKPSIHNEVRQEINTYYIDEGVDATDPANGKQIKITRLKAAPWARARLLGKSVELTSSKVAEILAKLPDLSKVYIDNTPEELQRMLNGEEINVFTKKEASSSESEDDSDDEAQAPAEAAPKATPKAATPKTEPKATTSKVESTKKAQPAKEESTGDAELDDLLANL